MSLEIVRSVSYGTRTIFGRDEGQVKLEETSGDVHTGLRGLLGRSPVSCYICDSTVLGVVLLLVHRRRVMS